ncbi:MAG: multiprotein bridging factor aMBF1 [Candidatus Bathyarchaeota archaeon]|jgi:putative transcription factor|nr:multiprotein bridging factor aMBF1 [Candidatus Bathyarchaeota archaeon]
MRCEVCGRKIHTEPIRAIIEGAKLTVCVECSKHGKVILHEEADLPKKVTAKPQAPISVVPKRPIVAKVEITQEVTEDYANKIKAAREKLALSHEELGKKINEKASVLRNLEAGKMAPNNQLASKLEHMLKIKLLVPVSEEKVTTLPKATSQELTLGDLIEMDKKGEASTERKPS